MTDEFFTALKPGSINTPNKTEMANILVAVAEWIKNVGNKKVQIELTVELSK